MKVAVATLLLVMAVISLLTAGHHPFIAYALRAPVFGSRAVLLLATAVI